MANKKCEICGDLLPEITEKCARCNSESGTPVFGDINGDGKVDYKDALAAGKIVVDKASQMAGDLVSEVKKPFKSQKQKDAEEFDRLSEVCSENDSGSSKECREFKAALESTIDLKFAEIMKSKDDSTNYLTYVDAQIMTASVRNIFKTTLKATPPQVEAACQLSEAVLAPTAKEKERLIKSTIGVAGGATGIGMVVTGVGAALGWGAGAISAIAAVVTGTSITGPVGMVVAGLSIAAVAGYFAASSNLHTDTERFINVLKTSSARAVDAIWDEFEDELLKSIAAN